MIAYYCCKCNKYFLQQKDDLRMYKCEHYTDSIFYQIEQTAKYCKTIGTQVFQKLNMPVTTEEFATLDVISQNDNICQRELAKLILRDRANTGRILNSLEKKGYIERFADTKNNRLVRRIKLTPSGIEVIDRCSSVLKEYINKFHYLFSIEDKLALKESIIRFRQSLEKEVEMNI